MAVTLYNAGVVLSGQTFGKAYRFGTRWLAITNTGQVYTSDNAGASWVAAGVISYGLPTAIIDNGSRIVAIRGAAGSTGVAYSDDGGDTWTTVSTSGLPDLGLGVGWHAGLWIVTRDSGSSVANGIYTSPDLATWTQRLTNTRANGLTVFSGLAVVGSNGVVYTSPDSIAWTSRSIAGSGMVVSGAEARGPRCLLRGFSGRVATSTDTITWSYQQLTAGLMTASGYDGTRWAIGDANGAIYASTTGLAGSWSNVRAASADSTKLLTPSTGGWVSVRASGAWSWSDDTASWTAGAALDAAVQDGATDGADVVILTSSSIYTTAPPPPPPETRVEMDWEVEVTAAPETRVALAWNVRVAVPAEVSLEWPVDVIAAAALGGLDGAGGWPAAPSGRWKAVLMIDDVDRSSWLQGPVSVTHARRQAAIAEFSILPSAPMLPMALIGRRVRIAVAERVGGAVVNAQLLFAGEIDEPAIDVRTGIVTCTCVDRLQAVVAATPRETLDAAVGGRWHVAVFGEPADSREYLEQRIQTVPADYALDVHGQLRILPWYGPGLRAVTVRRPEYFEGSLSLSLPTLDRLRTRCTVRAEFRYSRMWTRGAVAQYAQPMSFFLPEVTGGTPTLPGKLWLLSAMVEGAMSSVPGWTPVSTLSITHPPSGSWNLGDALDPWIYIISPEVAPTLAMAFSRHFAARWLQAVTEYVEIDVISPELETLIGRAIPDEIGAGITAEFDQRGWESDVTMAPNAIDASAPRVGDTVTPYYTDGATPADRDAMILTMLDVARCDRVMASAMSGRARFDMALRPDLWLDWEPALETPELRARGVVMSVTHTMDTGAGPASSSVEIAVSLPGNVEPAAPVWSVPAVVDTTPAPPVAAWSFNIGTHVGGVAGAPAFDDETMVGFITNYEGVSTAGLNYYPHKLSVDSPAIAAEHRDPLELVATAQVEIEIPLNTLEIL